MLPDATLPREKPTENGIGLRAGRDAIAQHLGRGKV